MRIFKDILGLTFAALMLACPLNGDATPQGSQDTLCQDAPSVRTRPGGLEIDVPGDAQTRIEIFALTGQSVKQIDAQPGTTSIDLPAGIYIVRVGHTAITVKVQ